MDVSCVITWNNWTPLAYRKHCRHPLTLHIHSDLHLVSQPSTTAFVHFAGFKKMNEAES